MLRSGIPVEPLGIECMDWVQEPEDEIFLGRMVSANDFYYENDDAAAPIEQSPNDVMMGHLKITEKIVSQDLVSCEHCVYVCG